MFVISGSVRHLVDLIVGDATGCGIATRSYLMKCLNLSDETEAVWRWELMSKRRR